MVKVKNINYENYLKYYYDKKIILFGSGSLLEDFLRTQRHKVDLFNKIDYILDNDPIKSGKNHSIGLRTISVVSVETFLKQKIDLRNYIVMLLVKDKFFRNVIDELDSISEFDDIICLYGITALFWGKEVYLPEAGKNNLPIPGKKHCIPKVIHYCWFGGNAMGEIEKNCIKSWKEHCPDFEFKLWNEENYDISKAPIYVRQAYKAKKYAFASDFARLDIIYKNGGFYLDADVLLLRGLDDFTKYRAVYGYLAWNQITTGLGFGSVAGNGDLLEQMNMYEQLLFLNDGEQNLIPCPEYSTDYFRKKGMRIDNTLRLIDDTLFLPSDFLCSLMPVLETNGQYYLSLYALTENSYALHMCASTWFEADNYNTFKNSKDIKAEINARLLADWKRG